MSEIVLESPLQNVLINSAGAGLGAEDSAGGGANRPLHLITGELEFMCALVDLLGGGWRRLTWPLLV